MLDMNLPKMTARDLPLFRKLVEDIFPGVSVTQNDHSEVVFFSPAEWSKERFSSSIKMIEAIEREIDENNLERNETTIRKVLEFDETRRFRHSVMLIGKTLSGKTTTWKLFQKASKSSNKKVGVSRIVSTED